VAGKKRGRRFILRYGSWLQNHARRQQVPWSPLGRAASEWATLHAIAPAAYPRGPPSLIPPIDDASENDEDQNDSCSFAPDRLRLLRCRNGHAPMSADKASHRGPSAAYERATSWLADRADTMTDAEGETTDPATTSGGDVSKATTEASESNGADAASDQSNSRKRPASYSDSSDSRSAAVADSQPRRRMRCSPTGGEVSSGLEMHLVVLGSGSARPSPKRNCSGLLIYATSPPPPAAPPQPNPTTNDDHRGSGVAVWALLLDCGEGVLGQIQEHFSEAGSGGVGSDDVLRVLRGVWISHKHADHHGGLPALLEHMARLRGQSPPNSHAPLPPLVLIAAHEVLSHVRVHLSLSLRLPSSPSSPSPPPSSSFCEGFPGGIVVATPSDANWPESPAHSILVASSATVMPSSSQQPPQQPPQQPYQQHYNQQPPPYAYPQHSAQPTPLLLNISSVPVIHCKGACGVVLTFHRLHQQYQLQQQRVRPFVLVYSGDTRPAPYLAVAGSGCDVLVHEATFSDDRAEDARKKNHSTYSEALGVARRMAVRGVVLLTHCSQRYAHRVTSAAPAVLAVGGAEEGAMSTSSSKSSSSAARNWGLTLQAHDHLEVSDIQGLAAEAEAVSTAAAAATTSAVGGGVARLRGESGLLDDYFSRVGERGDNNDGPVSTAEA
jgi:ribonuclease BN (tRNA processing enzyme)